MGTSRVRCVDAFAGLVDEKRLRAVPSLAGALRARPLTGGITNRNYAVDLPGKRVVVRMSDPESSALAIDRQNEYLNSVSAAASGAGAGVLDYLPGAGVLIVEWIEGRTLTEEDIRTPENLPRIAAACRQLHAGPAFASRFDMFEIQARYLTLVRERGFRLPERYLEFTPLVERIRAAMAADPEPLVPCNNDLLAANFIDTDDHLRLIDYEYSGMNEASFELGNIWSESTLPDDLLPVLTEAYWGPGRPDKVARARLWAVMSQYGWTLWASIQDSISAIDFDFWAWGLQKYERAVAAFDGPDFDGWLTAIESK